MTFIVILAIVTGMFIGFRRGFLRSVFKLLITILSIVLSYVLAPLIANWVISYTSFDDNLQASISAQIENTARQQIRSQLEASVGVYGIPVTDDMVNAALDTQLSQSQQTDVLNQITMPESVRQSLVEETIQNTAGYAASEFYRYIAGLLAKMIVRAVVYAATFLVISILLFLIYMVLSLALKMASLGGANRVAGAVFGGAQALVYVWLLLIVIHCLVGTSIGTLFENQIQNNVVLAFIDSHNLLQPIANRMLAKVF